MMNRLLSPLIIFSLLLGLLLVPATPSLAQITLADDEQVSLAQLGLDEQSLRGPFDAAQLDFSLPATWALDDGAAIQLNLATFFAGQAGQTGSAERTFGGTLQVVFNDVRVGTILLDQIGERTVRVPISTAALSAPRRNDRYRLSLLLDTAEQCGLEQYTNVIIRSSSALVLPHRTVAPSTELAQLPRPIVQRSFLPDAATIVVPDQPSASELQAALAIAAGLGRMTESGSTFALELTPASRVTAELRATTHLIVVGTAATLPLRDQLDLRALSEQTGDDGIVQMIVSPWSAAHVVLAVTGRSDAAVTKAAQAVSTGALHGAEQPDRALIAAIQPAADTSSASSDRTFAALGYDVQQMYGQGAQYAVYRFDLPASQVISDEAYLDLTFVHTALLDYDQSGMTINVNGEPIASVRLDDTSTRLSTTRIDLPASALRAGSNMLVIRGDLLPRAICSDPRGNGLWLTIRPESSLHLPLNPTPDPAATPTIDLKRYPLPFTSSANLKRVAFVVAANDPAAWHVAMQLAFDLGRQTPGTVADLAVVLGGAVPEQLRNERDLVLVGRPSALPLINELGSALPAPFAANSDIAADPHTQVIYRQTSGASIGYVQLLAAPWDARRTVLAVLGSTDEGLAWAGAALTQPERRSQLSGNLAVVNDEQIDASDTRPAAPTADEQAAQPAATTAPTTSLTRMIMLAGAIIALLVLILLAALLLVWHRRRARRAALTDSA